MLRVDAGRARTTSEAAVASSLFGVPGLGDAEDRPLWHETTRVPAKREVRRRGVLPPGSPISTGRKSCLQVAAGPRREAPLTDVSLPPIAPFPRSAPRPSPPLPLLMPRAFCMRRVSCVAREGSSGQARLL